MVALDGGRYLFIRSEEDAWSALEALTKGHKFPDDLIVKFDGWPKYDLHVKGRDWHSSVPTRIMGPLLEVQRDLWRAYANLLYGEPNARRLKDDERDEFELVVNVAPGSSQLEVKLDVKLTELAKAAIEKMGPNQILGAVLGAALVWGGVTVNKDWVAQRVAQKQAEVTVQLSQEETRRMTIFAEAVKQTPVINEIKEDALSSQSKVLKSMHPADKIESKGIELSGAVANEIAQADREYAQDVYLYGLYRIEGNRTDKGTGFRIRLRSAQDETIITADAPLELPDAQRDILRDAEWGKSLVYVHITASMLRGQISQAVITSARLPTKQEMDALN